MYIIACNEPLPKCTPFIHITRNVNSVSADTGKHILFTCKNLKLFCLPFILQ